MQYKRNIIEGTVHKVFRKTSAGESFDRVLEKNWKQWIEKKYPKSWSDRVVFESLDKNIGENKLRGEGIRTEKL